MVNCYIQIRESLTDVQTILKEHQDRHSPGYYYEIRSSAPSDGLTQAARFLYLNRTCWNGLYRVNKRGEFNVPIGTKNKVSYDPGQLELVSAALAGVDLMCCDFEISIDQAGQGDFVFVDPPYTANHNMNGFLKYNENIFSWVDQIRLRDAVARAAARGAYVMITNADHDSVRDLYQGYANYQQVARSSILAGKADKRRCTTEAIFTANI